MASEQKRGSRSKSGSSQQKYQNLLDQKTNKKLVKKTETSD
jgi:hypothetical protein